MIKSSVKITLLGQSSTGKSSLVGRLVNNNFYPNLESTIGASFMTLKIDNIKYDIWDTAGQERFLSIAPMYYRNSDINLLVFDVSDLETIDRLVYYMEKIIYDLTLNQHIIIVGNKTDLIDNDEIKNIDKLVKNKFSKYYDFDKQISYIYTSAKENNNCMELLESIKDISYKIAQENSDFNDNNIKLFNNVQSSNSCSC